MSSESGPFIPVFIEVIYYSEKKSEFFERLATKWLSNRPNL